MKRLLMFVMLVCLFGLMGCAGDAKKKDEKTLASIVLTTSKESVTANGEDQITFSAKAYDGNNEEISAAIAIYKGSGIFTEKSFKTTSAGVYIFTAKSGNIVSGAVTVTAVAVSTPTSIVLTADKTEITANGTETVTLTGCVKDQSNATMSGITLEYYVDDLKLTGNLFTTTKAGVYKLTAKAGAIVSNEVTVTASGYRIEVSVDGNGTVKLTPDKPEYEENEEVAVEAVCDDYTLFQG